MSKSFTDPANQGVQPQEAQAMGAMSGVVSIRPGFWSRFRGLMTGGPHSRESAECQSKEITSKALRDMMGQGLVVLLDKLETGGVNLAKSGIFIPPKKGAYRTPEIDDSVIAQMRYCNPTIRALIDKNHLIDQIFASAKSDIESEDACIRCNAVCLLIQIALDETLHTEAERLRAIQLLLSSVAKSEEAKAALVEFGYTEGKITELADIATTPPWKAKLSKNDIRFSAVLAVGGLVSAIAMVATGIITDPGLVASVLCFTPIVAATTPFQRQMVELSNELNRLMNRVVPLYPSLPLPNQGVLQGVLKEADEMKSLPRMQTPKYAALPQNTDPQQPLLEPHVGGTNPVGNRSPTNGSAAA